MALRFWRQQARNGRTAKGKTKAARTARLWLEALEDRTVLNAVTQSFSGSSLQFDGDQAINTFLGDSFNASASFGSIHHVDLLGDFGATAQMSIGGTAGLNLTFSGDGGNVSAAYNATLNQSFAQPNSFGEVVSFNPGNTFVTANSGSFSTTSPSFGYGASLDLGLNGSIGGQFEAFSEGGGGSFSFGGNVSVPLMSVNENNSGEVDLLGLPIVGASPGLGLSATMQKLVGAVEDEILNHFLKFGLSNDPPLRLTLQLSTPQNLQFEQDLQLELGLPKQLGAYTVPKAAQNYNVAAAIDLASLVEQAPSIALGSNQVQADGTLSASGQSNVAQLNIQAGPLVADLLGIPALAAATDTVSVKLGSFDVNFTPMSFQIQPTLYAAQTATVEPVSLLTYNFSSPVVVTLDGAPYNGGNPTSSVTFTAGKDTVGVHFEGQPITVTPTWTFEEQYHDRVNLDAALEGLLTVGEISVHVPGLGDRSFGPLYSKSFNFANTTLQSLFDQTTTISSQTVALAPFTIGTSFHPSTAVTSFADSATQGGGSLRFAVLSANALDLSTPVVIQLAAGVYNLSLPPGGIEDGSAGDVVVTAPNLIVVGAGGLNTIVDAYGLGDRLFHLMGAAHVKFVGVGFTGGHALAGEPGLGGGIMTDAGTSLELDDCVVQNNTVSSEGGGIYSQGALTVNDTTISDNLANGGGSGTTSGGGIAVESGSLTLEDSTISNNSAYDSVNAYGGGLYLVSSDATIESSTISNNEADGEARDSNGRLTATGQAHGGGLYLGGAGARELIVDSTIYANQAISGAQEAFGGGITVGVQLYLVGDTIAYNTASEGNSGIEADGVSFVMKDTIVAHNDIFNSVSIYGAGPPVLSGGNNLIDVSQQGLAYVNAAHGLQFSSGGAPTTSAGGWDPTDLVGTYGQPVDPLLGTFGANGGPTPTLPLLAGSPAIDAGGNTFAIPTLLDQIPDTDQRGLPGVVNGTRDIGAVEYQYDLALTGGVSAASPVAGDLTYSYTVANNGPDPAGGVTLNFPLPNDVFYISTAQPGNWTAAVPHAGAASGTVTFTLNSGSALAQGQSAAFTITVLQGYPYPTAPMSTTASINTAPWDSNAGNNQVVSTVFPEGVPFTNAVLGYFAPGDPDLTAADFSASVTWGDGGSNSSGDGTAAIAVVPNPLGGFNAVGSHTYAEAGNYTASVTVQGGHGFAPITLTPNMAVSDQNLSPFDPVGSISPPALNLTTSLTKAILYHFLDPNTQYGAADFQATAYWGDGTSNTSGDGKGAVQVVADAAGGFDVLGTHDYGSSATGELYAVRVVDPSGLVMINPVLFHFTDGNPLATAADFRATVSWGDGATSSSSDANPSVFIVANPTGGFDVLAAHAYTQYVRNGTLQVMVRDVEGSGADGFGPVEVDYPLTAVALTVPQVKTEGDSVQNALLFHFTDGDPQGQFYDFQATILWGDGTDGSGVVRADPNGGFDVYGSHVYGEAPVGALFGVTVNDRFGAVTGASATFANAVADPPVSATGATLPGPINEDSPTGPLTVATFTDPGGAEALGDYSASIDWGDHTPADSGTISYDANSQTFTVRGNHTYARAASYTITVAVGHDQTAAVKVTDSVAVADVAVTLAGGFSLSTVYGQSTGTQPVATFTDPGGASSLADYQATVSWGDGSSSAGVIGYDTAAPFTFASNLPTGHGPGAVAAADLDGDRHLDLVVANALDDSVQVFLGNGDGTFQAPLAYSLGAASPTALAVADLGNGHLDIVTANSNTGTVSVLLGNGDGTFQVLAPLTAGTNPSAIALGNLGNGHVDIVTANRSSDDVSVFLGNGDGTFGAATSFAAGESPDGVAIGDVNGDGKPDVVVADAGDDSVWVMLGNGRGRLQGSTTFAVGSQPSAVALARLSAGPLDIVTANAGSNNVSVLMGNGDSTFQPAVNYAVGSVPAALLVTDANGDGKPDVVTANNGDNSVSVLAGVGNGTFGTATSYALGSGATAPTSVAVGDLDGAGVADLVTANSLSDNLTLLLPPYTVTGGNKYAAASGAHPFVVGVKVGHGNTSASGNTATVAVTPAPLTITAQDQTMTYGGTMPALTAKFDGLVNGDQPGAVTGLSLATAPAGSAVGTYPITATGATDGNYTITLVNGTLHITPAPLTITADDKSMTYGGSLPALTATFNGLVNGDQPSAVTGLSLSTVAASSHVGNYAITASGATDGNYTIALNNGTLHITAAPLTITADNRTMPYGGPLPALTVSYSGLTNGDTPTSFAALNPGLTVGTTATSASHVAGGPYPITVSGASDNDYSITYMQGGLTVTPVALTITADNKTMVYGTPLPAFTASYSGFVNGDRAGSLTRPPSYSTPATSASPPATYAITPGGASDGDYSISYVAGTLTVTPAPLSAMGLDISATAGAPFSGTVATFTNADPYGGASSYVAVITWGDGSSSAGTITAGSGSTLIVSGTHTYAAAGSNPVGVQISHKRGYTTAATTSATATVTGLGVAVQRGQAGGIGFWQNKNGQALIAGFGTTAAGQSLANWLASNFSHLFGGLAGMSNAQVASYYLTQFSQSGPKLGAEVMATALNVYATTSSLGGAAGQAYGFTVSAYGLGASSYNVGGNGAAFGVANNTTLNVYQLLQAADGRVVKGVLYGGNATLITDAVNVFDGINSAGGI